MNLFDEIENYGLVPVIAIENLDDALPLAKALIDGGLNVAEVTFRTSCASEAIAAIKKEYPNMIVGAGTVLSKQQVDESIRAGAQFIVSPGFNPVIVKYCNEKKIPILPGISSPSDIEQALELGLRVVKFFPAETSGGLDAIKAMSAPYGNLKFMPTGGISQKNLSEYLAFPNILACGGSWMVQKDLISNKHFDQITNITKRAIHTVMNLNVDLLEVESGVTTLSTNQMKRAKFHLSRQGIQFDKNNWNEKLGIQLKGRE